MNDQRNVFRITAAAWLLGWFLKAYFYGKYLFIEIEKVPMVIGFFPKIMASPWLAQVSYLLPLLVLGVLGTSRTSYFRFSAFVMLISSFVLLCHMVSHNDATFVTSFWVALWLLWMSFQLDSGDKDVTRIGIMLAQCLLGMVFLGGAVGKLTPEYLNGDIFYQLFVAQGHRGPVQGLFQLVGGDLRSGSLWVARGILSIELILAAAPLWPAKSILLLAFIIMPLAVVFSTWKILSVMLCLMGMCLACLYWRRCRPYA